VHQAGQLIGGVERLRHPRPVGVESQ
jgi:hypothetical protein